MVASFGRARNEPEPVVVPDEPPAPTAAPGVAVIVLAVDEESLTRFETQVREAVARAVRAGFADAVGEELGPPPPAADAAGQPQTA